MNGMRPGGRAKNEKYCGVDIACVTRIDDPDNQNRVRCKRVTFENDVAETDWIYVMSPLAGPGYGMAMLPRVGDYVLLAYIGGDMHYPFVIGSIWSQSQSAPPINIQNGVNNTYLFRLPSGMNVCFSEEQGNESMALTTPKGFKINVSDGDKKIELSDDSGSNHMVIDASGSGELVIEAKSKITIKAGSVSITLDGSSGVTIDAGTKLSMKATSVEAQATSDLSAKGNASMTLESSGMTQVKGSVVKLN